VKIPYVTCHYVTEEKVCQVPHQVCSMEPYCHTYKVCRKVPVCVPVCEPACPPPCCPPPCCPSVPVSRKVGSSEWFARLSDKVRHCRGEQPACGDN
jgi:hypothetical protein